MMFLVALLSCSPLMPGRINVRPIVNLMNFINEKIAPSEFLGTRQIFFTAHCLSQSPPCSEAYRPRTILFINAQERCRLFSDSEERNILPFAPGVNVLICAAPLISAVLLVCLRSLAKCLWYLSFLPPVSTPLPPHPHSIL